MSRPLFAVGEEVILQSVNYPEANGDYVIIEAFYGQALDSVTRELETAFFYMLDTDAYKKGEWWHQESLRKKHKPTDESFDEMMNNIKQNNKLTVSDCK